MTLVTMLHRSLVDNPLGWALPAIGCPSLGTRTWVRITAPASSCHCATRQWRSLPGKSPKADSSRELSPEVIVDAVAGSFVFRRVMDDEPPTLAEVRRLVAELTGVGAGDGFTGSARAVGYGSTPQSLPGPARLGRGRIGHTWMRSCSSW